MPMRLAGSAGPGPWGDPQGRGYPGHPLQAHQIGKQAVCASMKAVLVFLKERCPPVYQGVLTARVANYFLHAGHPFSSSVPRREQPKTGVLIKFDSSWFNKAIMAVRPGLSPE